MLKDYKQNKGNTNIIGKKYKVKHNLGRVQERQNVVVLFYPYVTYLHVDKNVFLKITKIFLFIFSTGYLCYFFEHFVSCQLMS